MNTDKNIKKTPLLDRYIQSIIQEQMNEFEEHRLAQVVRGLLNETETNRQNIN